MFYLYLASLIFGGTLLGISLLAGGDDADGHDGMDGDHSFDADHSLDGDTSFDADHSLDMDHSMDMDHSLDMDHSMDGGLDADTDIDADVSGHDIVHSDTHMQTHSDASAVDAVKLFSFRNIIYFLAFFGLTGTVTTSLSAAVEIAFASSMGMGSFAFFLGYQFMKYLKKTESGEALNIYNFKGKTALVTLNVSKERRGKIRVEAGDQTLEILAKASDVAKKDVFERGEHVLIIDIKDMTAFVVHSDY